MSTASGWTTHGASSADRATQGRRRRGPGGGPPTLSPNRAGLFAGSLSRSHSGSSAGSRNGGSTGASPSPSRHSFGRTNSGHGAGGHSSSFGSLGNPSPRSDAAEGVASSAPAPRAPTGALRSTNKRFADLRVGNGSGSGSSGNTPRSRDSTPASGGSSRSGGSHFRSSAPRGRRGKNSLAPQSPAASPVKVAQGTKIFVGGLSWSTDEAGLRTYFSKFGQVEDTVVMRTRHTLKPRGFGFVIFSNKLAPEDIVGHDHVLDDKRVEVKIAVPKEPAGSTRDFSGAAPDATPAGGERPAPYRSSTSNASWSSRGSGSRGDDDTRFRDLRGGSRRGQRRGSNGNAAAGANGGPRGDPYVRKDSYRSMDSFRSDDSHNDGTRDFEGLRRGRSGDYRRGPSFGSDAPLSRRGSFSRQSSGRRDSGSGLGSQTVRVSGLPTSVTTAALHRHFSRFGPIQEARIIVDDSQRSSGKAVITFDSLVSCAQALAIPQHTIDGVDVVVVDGSPTSRARTSSDTGTPSSGVYVPAYRRSGSSSSASAPASSPAHGAIPPPLAPAASAASPAVAAAPPPSVPSGRLQRGVVRAAPPVVVPVGNASVAPGLQVPVTTPAPAPGLPTTAELDDGDAVANVDALFAPAGDSGAPGLFFSPAFEEPTAGDAESGHQPLYARHSSASLGD